MRCDVCRRTVQTHTDPWDITGEICFVCEQKRTEFFTLVEV